MTGTERLLFSIRDYTLEVTGEGTVDYTGNSFVLISGHHQGHISKKAVDSLLAAFRKANFFSAKDEYVASISDGATRMLTLPMDGKSRSVKDNLGLSAGMPVAIEALEETLDQISGTDKWIEGNQQTGPALVAEHWDFKANTEENRAYLPRWWSQVAAI